jgi:hypothetical protein
MSLLRTNRDPESFRLNTSPAGRPASRLGPTLIFGFRVPGLVFAFGSRIWGFVFLKIFSRFQSFGVRVAA